MQTEIVRPASSAFDLREQVAYQALQHDLAPLAERFSRYKTRRDLVRDARYQENAAQLVQVLDGWEWDLSLPPGLVPAPKRPGVLRAVSWNIERGKRFQPLRSMLTQHPILREADILMLNEVDLGMGRSENRNIARELAGLLGMRYVFANSYWVLSPGDLAEQDHRTPNTLALHGNAFLSRYPIGRVEAVRLPEHNDKFEVLEKRLGDKRAMLVELLLPDGPLWCAVVHLDPFCGARHRAWQMRLITERLSRLRPERVLLGGDLNTNTYDATNRFTIARSLMHKMFRLGLRETVRHYLHPDERLERPVFEALWNAGLSLDGYNDRSFGTIYYDMDNSEVIAKSASYMSETFTRRLNEWMQRRNIGPQVPLRLDWFAGKGLSPIGNGVIPRANWEDQPISDHDPIYVDLALGRVGEG
jgi:endonuclease/exonuclease/phosphatase family metal-dependent hydrolase